MRVMTESEVMTNHMEVLPNDLVLGDCLKIMKYIPEKSVSLILTDLPYG